MTVEGEMHLAGNNCIRKCIVVACGHCVTKRLKLKGVKRCRRKE